MQASPTLDRAKAQHLLSSFNLPAFFTELMGWNDTVPTRATYLDVPFTTIAEKRGYTVLVADGIPPYPIRAQLDRLIARDHREHILIFADPAAHRQVWQVSIRRKGQPVRLREVIYSGNSGEELIQKLEALVVPLAREDDTHLDDLTHAARATFDRDKVTKAFYKQFELQHKAFLKFLRGVPKGNEAWYVSVLINRLMFLYFMQSKSFLDGNPNYLVEKLEASQAAKKDVFYRNFLCPLFFLGFALPKPRPRPIDALLGDVPYLNGGLFQKHTIELEAERASTPIQIPDAAFQQLFDFFGKWNWHLDTSEKSTGNEIDPDVLGYIFEKYINNKQMGAYYTKEDITGYIAQNTIIPFLFDTARKGCANAFEPEGAIWRMLRDDPNRYIYAAVRRGNQPDGPSLSGLIGRGSPNLPTRLTLPPEIAAGLDNVSLRTHWNRPIPAEFAAAALPTETWREFIARRRRYDELLVSITAGEVHQVNDLITLNLDIRQLALDSIQIAGSEDLVESLYKAIESVTILDPTCGSGAFLFAALELLQPLYQACLDRMESFIEEEEAAAAALGRKLHPKRFAPFRKTLEAAAKHVNTSYFILKTIVVQNLYGVDIMEEATEICKLRLFLKLVGQLDAKDKDRIEPLPDIDFNIRPGNTLVGYARYDDVKNAAGGKLFDAEEAMSRIDDRLQTIDAAAAQFRRQQTELGGSVSAEDKQELTTLYKDLESELDDFLAAEYGIKKKELGDWKRNTKPFHWFCDFHSILQQGGFNVVVGNPPYVEYAKVRSQYVLDGFSTLPSGNLYAMMIERSQQLTRNTGRFGMIIPLSFVCTDRMQSVRDAVTGGMIWTSSFDMRPSSLFEGVAQRLTILLWAHKASKDAVLTAGYKRWTGVERDSLIPLLSYSFITTAGTGSIAKIDEPIEQKILTKLSLPPLGMMVQRTASPIYVHRIIRYFVKALDEVPFFLGTSGAVGRSPDFKPFSFQPAQAPGIAALLNSSFFYWHWRTFSDGFHCGYGDVYETPFQPFPPLTIELLSQSNGKLQADLIAHSVKKTIRTAGGAITYQEFYPKESKPIIDEIDRALAGHYGFTDEELDFIINYDIKYRMGADATTPEEGD